jgi:hypothetical protein
MVFEKETYLQLNGGYSYKVLNCRIVKLLTLNI